MCEIQRAGHFLRFYQLENLEKAIKMERRDKNIFGHPQTSNTSMVLGSGFQWFWVLGLGARKAQGPD